MKKQNKSKQHDKCKCKDCEERRKLTQIVLDNWVKSEASMIANRIIHGEKNVWNETKDTWKGLNDSLKVPKHKHILIQKNFLDASYLRCDCGMVFIWNITKQQYEEQ